MKGAKEREEREREADVERVSSSREASAPM